MKKQQTPIKKMKILFLGEEKGGSAEYMLQPLTHLGHEVVHFGSRVKCPLKHLKAFYDIIILSDYDSENLTNDKVEIIKTKVKEGSKLIMIGGWISFNGKGISYYNHPLSEIFPVLLKSKDDRVNYHQGLFLFPGKKIKKISDLSWDSPPVICGYNDAEPKPEAKVLVWMKKAKTDGRSIKLKKKQPFLIQSPFGEGQILALLTDMAPHWCGGLVDWGKKRVSLPPVEIGDDYIKFIDLLINL